MPEQPNIVMILCDELRADALGCFGNPIVKTPNIDRLAQQGTLFSECMITQPTCTPSRASILTGCYPSALHSRMVGCYTPDDPRFLPRILSQNGYRTASIGKIHLVPQKDEPTTIDQRLASGDNTYYGFQEIDLVDGHGDGCFGPRYTRWLNERVPDVAARLAKKRFYPRGVNAYTWELPENVHSSHYVADQAVNFLGQPHERPFFLHVSFPDPHYPFTVPEPYASKYSPGDMPPPIPPVTTSHDMPPLYMQVYQHHQAENPESDHKPLDRVIGTPPHDYTKYDEKDWQQVKAIYYGMVSLLDDSIGRILDAVDFENTMVVFLSDHGDYLGDHGFYGKGLPYSSVLRTPLIWCGPNIQAGHVITSIESTLDIAPTLLDLAAIEEPEAIQGTSLKACLNGQSVERASIALTENDDDFARVRMRTITTDRWRLTYYLNQPLGELIDRINDPQEMHNLWRDPQYDHVREALLHRLLDETLASIDMHNGRIQQPTAPIPKWRAGR
ncbi:MAG: sulfatase-like hydrolase/transferase [Chloroflexi bacterium]|nr:sulfatase-like hydrolase/transferase [Chloroflexota bacterium]